MTRMWWQDAVIYQIYPRSFQDTNDDGIGDLQGIIDRLDYLNDGTPNSLGVGAIWLSPFYPSPMADFGYDVADYTDVDPMFGDLATFDRLVEEAHKRNMRIIVDFVPNHSSDQHPWFMESRSSKDNPRRDWYLWRDQKAGGGPPNNWLAVFGGSAWEWDETTQQYFYHSFLQEQPDLNWRNPEVMDAMLGVLRFWMDRGVDGFRIDAIHYMIKDALWRDNPPASEPPPLWVKSLGDYDKQQHLHDQNQPEVYEIIRRMRKQIDAYDGRVAIGETYVTDLDKLVAYYGDNLNGLHLPLNFRMMYLPWQATAFRAAVDEYEASLQSGATPNYVLGSHDEPRLASRFGEAKTRVAAMLLLTLRGTPIVYYGDEIGMIDVDIPPKIRQDPFGLRVPGLGLDRDRNRTPMQWNGNANAGFSGGSPWLPVAPDYTWHNAATQQVDRSSILTFYRRLIWARNQSPALGAGSYTPIDIASDTCYVYLRETDGEKKLVALNFTADPQEISLTEVATGATFQLSTHLDQPSVNIDALKLRPNEGLLLDLES